MINNWKRIWNSKSVETNQIEQSEFEEFCKLKLANGFDVAVDNKEAYYRAFYTAWLEFYDKAISIVGKDINGVYEVGCGSGVNLYMFKNRIQTRYGGLDYSEALISNIRDLLSDGDFISCDADRMSITPKYDIVMSESVFQYFDNHEYAEKVLRNMIEKSTKLVYLGEIHDAKYEDELMEYRRKTISDYENRYRGLKKLFYSKEWIENIAEEYGKKVEYTGVLNPEYINGKYLFNCYIY